MATASERAARVRLLLFDVDGVMTDGTTSIDSAGTESMRFHIRDGLGIVAARKCGLVTGLVSARDSVPAQLRADRLGVPHVRLGIRNKFEAVRELAAHEGVALDEVGFMGDDLVDLPVLAAVGFAAAPADAVAEVRARAHHVCLAAGGRGAVREVIEFILGAQGRWADVVAAYESAQS
jgi:3-deoxy-D-manno-octulosonate 8-phosphate phosphatase (KDO 8-P phosphatase)